jgi:hypothetical protein
LFVSELVLAEAAAGDPDAAARRAGILQGLAVIDVSPLAETLAGKILESADLPARARADALHIALAASHAMDYLMTWNTTHIANAQFRAKVERACRAAGYEPPVLCTPDELMAGEDHDA